MVLEYKINEKIDIKSFLLKNSFSLNIVNKLLNEKSNIFINNNVYTNNYTLNFGDTLKVVITDEKSTVIPIKKDIDIVYEDEYFLVVNKPKDLATIPSFSHYENNLAGRVLNYFNSQNYNIGIHIVNRLDYATCGIVVFAKNKFIHQLMSKVEICKKYRCVAKGIFENDNGIINAKIDRISTSSIKRAVLASGKTAITKYNVISTDGNNTLLDIELLTGRTHQIRVHMLHIGHPLIGDTLYGDTQNPPSSFYLCSYFISFTFPINNKQYFFDLLNH